MIKKNGLDFSCFSLPTVFQHCHISAVAINAVTMYIKCTWNDKLQQIAHCKSEQTAVDLLWTLIRLNNHAPSLTKCENWRCTMSVLDQGWHCDSLIKNDNVFNSVIYLDICMLCTAEHVAAARRCWAHSTRIRILKNRTICIDQYHMLL